MKITVVTPVLNGSKYISKTIESVLSQTGYFDLEYIIKDGGSDDSTLKCVEAFAKNPLLKIVSKKDKSLYDAINQGFEYGTGDIFCWIGADDYFEPGVFQKVFKAFSKYPERKWVYGRCAIVNAEGKEIQHAVSFYKNLIGYFYSYPILLCENYICQPATFWKKDLWEKVGGVDVNYSIAADYKLWLNFAQYSSAIVIHSNLANFRRDGLSISDTQFEKQFREELEVAKSFCGPFTYALHRFNCWKIINTYKLMRRANR